MTVGVSEKVTTNRRKPTMKMKIFVQVSSFQRLHIEQCEHQGVHPDSAFVCQTFEFPDDLVPPDDLLQAHRYADDAYDGEKMAVDLDQLARHHRRIVLGSNPALTFTVLGKKHIVRYLVAIPKTK
jgi:hypothetical protein